MKKLTMLLMLILTGLSISSCDPEESFHYHYYQLVFYNDTDKDLEIIYNDIVIDRKNTISILVDSKSKGISANLRSPFDFQEGKNEDITKESFERNLDIILDELPNNNRIIIKNNNEVIKIWNGKTNSYGSDLNAPYNYDSWVIKKAPKVIKDGANDLIYYGDIVFNITDKDLE